MLHKYTFGDCFEHCGMHVIYIGCSGSPDLFPLQALVHRLDCLGWSTECLHPMHANLKNKAVVAGLGKSLWWVELS